MPSTTLIVHAFSFNYVERFVRQLHSILRQHADPEASLLICDEVDSEPHPDGLVLVIGENFGPFTRRPGCRYVYLNLSVVTLLGSPLSASLSGHRQVFRKRRLLQSKLPFFDVVLDYYPSQTAQLQRQLPVPVLGFDVVVPPTAPAPVTTRPIDVCFVGGVSPRRHRILDQLSACGLALSPTSGGAIEDFAKKARCCLNVHLERSNHLEIPRILAALSTGCPMVTERSFGLSDLCDAPFIDGRTYGDLVAGVGEMLSDEGRLQHRADAAFRWYKEFYLPKAEAGWADLLRQLGAIPQPVHEAV